MQQTQGMMGMGIYASSALAVTVRVAFTVYGLWQDSTMQLKYTDVDYVVFTDAASFVVQGESPYNRSTYRYTPILAWILTPNILLSPHFGKIIFVLCDMIAGWIIYKTLRIQGYSERMALVCSWTWLFNPLPITVSSRGNAESIMAVLMLATLYCLQLDKERRAWKHITFAAFFYGIAVHMKIYPVIYAPAIYFGLNKDFNVLSNKDFNVLSSNSDVVFRLLYPNSKRLRFVMLSVGVFAFLTALCYHFYGFEFLQETYIYHITRKDSRHNFSPYFYLMYLTSDEQTLGLIAFLPQLILLPLIAVNLRHDLPAACFFATYVFVTFNKVCTSQYFLWYLCLLPLILPQLTAISLREGAFLLTIWLAGQGAVLYPSYLLEFEGQDTLFAIWIGSLVFFFINIYIMMRLITSLKRPLARDSNSSIEPKVLKKVQ